jgi:glutathione S-transferase
MITLFHSPRTRSSRFIFLLEELGAPYRIHSIARTDGAIGRDPANPHPHGKVPAIDDDGQAVFESAAIALYLTDRFPQNRIGPVVGDAKRGAYVTWLAYYAGVMEPAWTMSFLKVEAPKMMAGWAPVADVMAHVNRTLEAGPYLLGDAFSSADILVGTTFAMFMGGPMMEKTPLLEGYVQRVVGRPAYARAQAKEAEAEAAAG